MLQYSDIFFAQVGIFYPFVPILFLLFSSSYRCVMWKRHSKHRVALSYASGAGNGPKSIEPCLWRFEMRFFRYLALLSILLLPAAAYSHAQVSVGIGIGGPVYGGYGYPAPVCAYGYYGYYPYACAPYGYYGPSWFSGGLFIGAGPWYRGGYYGY